MKKVTLALVLILFLLHTALGFDGKRQGVLLGIGGGLGLVSFNDKATDSLGTSISSRGLKFAVMTDLKVGYAPSEQIELFYTYKGTWFSAGLDATFHYVLHALAVNYFFKPSEPSTFLGLGVGKCDLSTPFSSDPFIFGDASGLGFFVSCGRQYTTHLAFALDLMYGAPQKDRYKYKYIFKALSPRLSITATAF